MKGGFLKRYTDVPALIYLLKNRSITFLDPKSWDDTNDSYCISVYKAEKSLKTVLALCFTETSETYHHWRIFAGGTSGVCITFKRERLLKVLHEELNISYRAVEYMTLERMRNNNINIDMLPFVKRYGFQDEYEFRIIYEDKKYSQSYKNINVPLATIEKITLSPWIPKLLAESLKETIKEIEGCSKIKIVRSTLVSSDEWKRLVNDNLS